MGNANNSVIKANTPPDIISRIIVKAIEEANTNKILFQNFKIFLEVSFLASSLISIKFIYLISVPPQKEIQLITNFGLDLSTSLEALFSLAPKIAVELHTTL